MKKKNARINSSTFNSRFRLNESLNYFIGTHIFKDIMHSNLHFNDVLHTKKYEKKKRTLFTRVLEDQLFHDGVILYHTNRREYIYLIRKRFSMYCAILNPHVVRGKKGNIKFLFILNFFGENLIGKL